jgi:broad specificity phosphatase PhoE
MPNVLLVRHAETVYTAGGLISGDPADTECVLSESGKTQAETLGRALQECHLDLCVTTELLRTRQTADVALARRDVRRTVLPDFNDPLAGDFEGMALSDYRAWAEANGGVSAVPPEGGESLEMAFRRFARGYRRLANRNEAEILVIAHARRFQCCYPRSTVDQSKAARLSTPRSTASQANSFAKPSSTYPRSRGHSRTLAHRSLASPSVVSGGGRVVPGATIRSR